MTDGEPLTKTKRRVTRAALCNQHATAERDEAIADGIDRILEASQSEGEPDTTVVRFRHAADG